MIKEKIAYLNGLKDGMSIEDNNTKKLFDAVIEALNAIADHIDETDEYIEGIDEYVDELSELVDDMANELDAIEDVLDCDCDCDDDDCCCDCDDDDEDVVEVTCPFCKEPVCIDSDMFIGGDEIPCPNCGKVIFDKE